jgi:hypothetical protein
VRAVEIESGGLLESSLVDGGQVVPGACDIAHRALAGVTFQVERRSISQACLKYRREPFDEQFQTYLEDVWDGMSSERLR